MEAVHEAGPGLVPVRRLKPSIDERIQTIRIECVGLKPLILDASDPLELTDEPTRRRKVRRVGPPPKGYKPVPLVQVCEPKLYRGSDGELGFPADMLQACLVEGGRHIEVAKRPLTSKWDSFIPACVMLREEFIAFPEDSQAWVPDKRPGRDGVSLKRPRFDSWRFSCRLDVRLGAIEGMMLDHVIELVRVSGRRQGLGCFRHSEFKQFPDQSWQPAIFGAFRLTGWEKV